MGNVIKPCFNSVPLNICRGPGDILSSYITQNIRDISYCSCIINHSHWTPWYKISQGELYLYVYWYDMRHKSWSVQLWLYKIGYELDVFNIENLILSRNTISSKYTLFVVVRYQTLIVLPCLINGPAKIEGLTLSTPSIFFFETLYPI